MAVAYQYQNDYDNKQDRKGFKKKLLILGGGIIVLTIVAILGMPKKQVIQSTQTSEMVNLSSVEISPGDSSKLNNELKAGHSNSVAFLKKLFSNQNPKDLFYNQNVDDSGFIKVINSDFNIFADKCSFYGFAGYADQGKSLPSFKFTCTSSNQKSNSEQTYIYIATSNGYGDRVFNWQISTIDSYQLLIDKVHGINTKQGSN